MVTERGGMVSSRGGVVPPIVSLDLERVLGGAAPDAVVDNDYDPDANAAAAKAAMDKARVDIAANDAANARAMRR
jgi:hypothetical protein